MIDFNNLGSSIFATGIGVTLLAKIKEIWSIITKYCHFGYRIYVSTDGNSLTYINLYNFLKKIDEKKFNRNISFDINRENFFFGSSFTKEQSQQQTIIQAGTYILRPKWYQIIIVEANTVQKENNYKPNHTLSVKIFGIGAKKKQEEIIQNIKEASIDKRQLIYDPKNYDEIFVERRSFDTIYHQKKEEIIQFLDNYKSHKRLYTSNSLPYKTGILLYGPPGTGKTSIIKAIADYMNYSIIYISADYIIKSRDLQSKSIVVFEDIDKQLNAEAIQENYEEQDTIEEPDTISDISNKEEDNKKIESNKTTLLNNKLHTIMQLLDGLFSKDEIIFIATTNHIELLPPELIRDGRFDCKIELTNIDKENAQKMCKSFGFDLKDIVESNQEYPINPAYLQNLLLNKINHIKEI